MIKFFVSDLDGVMTDGGMYYTESGEEFKRFHVADGVGFLRLKEAGIKTAICTNGKSAISKHRAQKIQTDYLVDDCQNKLNSIQQILSEIGISLAETAFIGDDVWDVELLKVVGAAACPADAQDCVKSLPNIHILTKNGGCGCVREFVELILQENNSINNFNFDCFPIMKG